MQADDGLIDKWYEQNSSLLGKQIFHYKLCIFIAFLPYSQMFHKVYCYYVVGQMCPVIYHHKFSQHINFIYIYISNLY